MFNQLKLTPLLLAVALGTTPLHAQPAPQAKVAEPDKRSAEQSAPAQQAPPAPQQTKKNSPPDSGKDSPFDYHSSEDISEDVPVSFPVDI